MNKIKAAFQRLLYPPAPLLLAISVISYSILAFIFAVGKTKSVGAYAAYVLSAYALITDIAIIPELIRKIKRIILRVKVNSRILKRLRKTKFGNKFLDDIRFRGSINIYQGMVMNFAYMIFRLITGIVYSSVWSVSMAVYYLVLGIIRTYLIFSCRKKYKDKRSKEYEYKCCRTVGKLLLLLNIPMSSAIALMIVSNLNPVYSDTVIYLSAIYTFYMTALSVVNIVKFRRLGSPVLSAAKTINFIAAAMSVLGLQTAMISRFSKGNDLFRIKMNIITGSCICIIVIGIAIFMIINADRKAAKED